MSPYPNTIRDGEIDFESYLAATEAQAHVRTVDAFTDEVEARFGPEGEHRGDPLPWSKFDRFRLRPKEITLWFGWKGHGKSAFLSNIFCALMAQNRRCLVISPEFDCADVIARKIRQCAGTSDPTSAYRIAWMRWAFKRLWLVDLQRMLSADLVLGIVAYAIKDLQVNHILVDSLMKIDLGESGSDNSYYRAQGRFVSRLQQLAHTSSDTHIHLVAHARKRDDDTEVRRAPVSHDVAGAADIVNVCENVVSIWMNKRKQQSNDAKMNDDPDAIITIEAQRNLPAPWPKAQLWYGKGLRFKSAPNAPIDPIFDHVLQAVA